MEFGSVGVRTGKVTQPFISSCTILLLLKLRKTAPFYHHGYIFIPGISGIELQCRRRAAVHGAARGREQDLQRGLPHATGELQRHRARPGAFGALRQSEVSGEGGATWHWNGAGNGAWNGAWNGGIYHDKMISHGDLQ